MATKAINLFTGTYQIYIGRPDGNQDPRDLEVGEIGFLGNPFYENNHEDLLQFKGYFLKRVEEDLRFRKAVLSMYGANLGCVCSSDNHDCHGHFVAEWIDSHSDEYYKLYDPK